MTTIAFEPLILAFLIEALILTLAVLAAVFWFWHKQQHRDRKAALHLIDRLKGAVSGQSGELAAVLGDIATLPEDRRDEFIDAVLAQEKTLYRQILKLFLERDGRLLPQVEKQVRALTELYRELLRQLPGDEAGVGTPAQDDEELRLAREKINHLQNEVDELARQLQVAMDTIESLSSEYTRMFAPDRTSEELETSRKRILATLQSSQRRLQNQAPKFDDDDEDIIIVEITS